jgi:hypothetical protein
MLKSLDKLNTVHNSDEIYMNNGKKEYITVMK